MRTELYHLAQEWFTFALVLAVQLLLVLALRKPVRARLGAVACYRLWLLPLLWLPFYVLGPALFAALADAFAARSQDGGAYPPALQQFMEIELLPFTVDLTGVSELSASGSTAFGTWTLLAAIWASGTIALVAWQGCRWLNFSRHVHSRAAPLSAAERQREGANSYFDAHVPVVCLPGMNSAALFGVFKPVLLLPEDFSERYDSNQRHIILAHEAVHMRRRDNAWNLCALLLITFFWMNPLMFIAWRCFRLDQELSCDALALSQCTREQQKRYARTLLDSLGGESLLSARPALTAWNNLNDIKERSLMIKQHLRTATRPFVTLCSLLALATVGASLTVTFAELVTSTAQAAELTPRAQRAQLAEQEVELGKVEAELAVQEAELNQQETRLAEVEGELVTQKAELLEVEQSLKAQETQLAAQEAQVLGQTRQATQESRRAVQEAQQATQRSQQATQQAQQATQQSQQTTQQVQQAARQTSEQLPQAAQQSEQTVRAAQQLAKVEQQVTRATERADIARRPRSRLGVAREDELQGAATDIDAQTGRILSTTIEFLNDEQFTEAREALASLRVQRLSPYERSRYEQLMFNLEMQDEDYPAARAHLQAAIDSGGLTDEESSAVRYQIAQLYLQEESYADAAAALEAWIAAEANPKSAAYYLLAASYYYQDMFDEALPNAQKAIELADDTPQEGWLSMLATLYIQRMQFADAEPVVARMVDLFPDKTVYQNQLAELQALNAQQ